MPALGPKKKETLPKPDRVTEDFPQLSNEMQLSIMNKVKNGELSIEDAVNQARKDQQQMLRQQHLAEEEQKPSQYNFSVHKHSRYRWQKRVFQIDFKTKLLCSIEKGIVKKQLEFWQVKSCDDGVGSRFSISFKDHHDYELEATSLEDKHKIMQLVNQIIYGNIYSEGEGENAESKSPQQPQASQSLREGVLLLHRGGLASFKWVKYEAQLHPGQLTLVPFRRQSPTDVNITSPAPVSIVIHLSHGDTSIKKPYGFDTFTLITLKNEYNFRVSGGTDETNGPAAIQKERDAWVQAIDKLCSEWQRRSRGESVTMPSKIVQCLDIPEDAEDADNDAESPVGLSAPSGNQHFVYPSPSNNSGSSSNHSSASDTSHSHSEKPVAKLRSSKPNIVAPGALRSSPALSPVSPGVPALSTTSLVLSPASDALTHSPRVSQPSACESHSSAVAEPSAPNNPPPAPPSIPAPPPLPFKLKMMSKKPRTKAFHWDLVSSQKFAKSFWVQQSASRVEIDGLRLYEQFAVEDTVTVGASEPSNTQHIMLNQKIAHNFNIFLKSFPVQPGELKDKLFIVNEDDGGLSDEHITSLRRYVPTTDDVEKYKSHKGPVEELHIVDQYMMEMCNIPCLSTQLDLLLTLRELPISMQDLQPLINQKIRMCTQLYNCRSFVSVLEYILAIGNYLNENAGKRKAKGFCLSSLTKLAQFRGRDKKFTLLHALVEQIMLQEPSLASFTQELAEFETVPGASIKGLTAEVDVLKNELQKVIQYRKMSKKTNTGAHHPNFAKDLKMAIDRYNTDLSALTKTCEEMKKLYSATLVKFGEPADQDSRELFGLICQFVLDFKRAHAEIMTYQH
ncbi:formin-like protein 13 [Thalassophryne amazonica]|uniref:formin-like protein 13 n=1 Tax=Thalassophryne amazonica TaxID=390379 RepID=UPI001470B2F0|nr:formin-like protein 13 [Thalassophryne amazonica]